jgi:putative transposase
MVLGDLGGMLPDMIVVDHGKIYLSEHTRRVCERLGISIQPAIPEPTDKPALERFFRTLRQSLLQHLPDRGLAERCNYPPGLGLRRPDPITHP